MRQKHKGTFIKIDTSSLWPLGAQLGPLGPMPPSNRTSEFTFSSREVGQPSRKMYVPISRSLKLNYNIFLSSIHISGSVFTTGHQIILNQMFHILDLLILKSVELWKLTREKSTQILRKKSHVVQEHRGGS